jgi:hypothetical protein
MDLYANLLRQWAFSKENDSHRHIIPTKDAEVSTTALQKWVKRSTPTLTF